MKTETLTERKQRELEALNNILTNNNLLGYKIHEWAGGKKKYFLTDDKGNSLTGCWDYISLNHFIMGYAKAMKKVNNYDGLLRALKNMVNLSYDTARPTKADKNFNIDKAIEAIKAAEQ